MTKNTKIAILIDQLIPGGVQKTAIGQVKYLNKLGFQRKLFTLMRSGYKKEYSYLVKNIPHQFLQDSYPLPFRKNFKLPFFSFLSVLHLTSPFLALEELKKYNPDVIVSHGSTTSFTAFTVKKRVGIDYLFMIHDPMVYILDKIYTNSPLYFLSSFIKMVATYLEKRLVKNAKFVTIDSRLHRKFIKEKYDTDPKILYLGTEFHEKPLSTLGDHILTTGRWGRGKNLQLLLEALPYFPKTKLTVAGIWGNQDDLRWFKNLVFEKRLKERVRIITHYKDQDFKEIGSQARVWVLPHQEAFSISALEAAGIGLPIIIPKNSGVTDLLKDHEDGIFLEKTTKKSLIEALRVFFDDKRNSERIGKSAARKARKYYSLANHTQNLTTLIKNVTITNHPKIIALEAGHVGKVGIAGGDLLLSKMVSKFKKSLDLSVIIPKANTFHWQNLKKQINIIPLTHTFLDDFTSPWFVLLNYLLRSIKITRLIVKTSPDTFIYPSTATLPDVLPAFVAKTLNPRRTWIARIHHLSPPPFKRPGNLLINAGSSLIQKTSTTAIKNRADIVLVLNESLKTTLKKQGFNSTNLEVLEGGVDYFALRKFKPIAGESYDAVYLGRIHATKGVFDLPFIWQQVIKKKRPAKLAIIGTGSGDNIKKLKTMIFKNGLSKNVKILGFISQKRLWSILKNSKVFLFCDHEAGWGLAVAEAMTSGMPVVGWDIGILGQVFKKGYIKIPLGNIENFSQAILDLLENDIKYKKLSREALLEPSRLDWTKTSRKFSLILERIQKSQKWLKN